MNLLEQTKTSKGFVPIKRFDTVDSLGGAFKFTLLSADELTPDTSSAIQPRTAKPQSLEALATCIKKNAGDAAGDGIYREDFFKLGKSIGPLFGQSAIESFDSWKWACRAAHDALVLQGVANKPVAVKNCRDIVSKTLLVNPATQAALYLYDYQFVIGDSNNNEYSDCFRDLPLLHHINDSDYHEYAVCSRTELDGLSWVSIQLFCFPEEISLEDFIGVLNASVEDEQFLENLKNQAKQVIGSIDESSKGLIEKASPYALNRADSTYDVRIEAVEKSDAKQIEHIVQADVSLHLRDIRLDLFQSNSHDDFMAFPHALSYLWYRFAKELTQVNVAYCEYCQTPYYVTGHRGIARRFCSEKCKTASKNLRTKNQRDATRVLYIKQGKTPEQIVVELVGKKPTKANIDAVKRDLRGSKEIKQRIRNGDTALLLRAQKDGLLSADEAIRFAKADPKLNKRLKAAQQKSKRS